MAESAAPQVAVVVVTWNGRDQLQRCLTALRRQTYRDFVTVVVDNGSRDGTAAMVREAFPWVRLIENGRNLGFAAANNVGIRATACPMVVTLNNDTVPEPAWLEALVRAAEADPRLGSVASKMVAARNPAMIDSCGIALDPAGIAWDLDGGYPAALVDRPREVFGPCAGAALYRRTMLEDVGLFDEDFFAYLEDVDLAWRARLRGWACRLEPAAVVRHEHAATLGDASPVKRFLLARNKVWTVAKNLPAGGLWWCVPLVVLYDVGAVTFALARQRDWASLHGRLAGLVGLPRALAKRRAIQARRTVTGADVARHYAPLALPWDVPRRYRHLTSPMPHVHQPAASAPGAMPRPSTRERARALVLSGVGALLRPPAARRAAATRHGARPAPRILLIRPDHLGDALLSRPAVELLRQSLPGAEITLLVGSWSLPSWHGAPVRLATFPFPGFRREVGAKAWAPYRDLLALAVRLRRERYDAAVVMRPDHWWGALAAALAGIPIRVGYRVPAVAPLLTLGLALPAPEPTARSALRLARVLARELGGSAVAVDQTPVFEPGAPARRDARAWLEAHCAGRTPRVAIHPGAGARVKCWPAARWGAVARALAQDAEVILTAASDEDAMLAAIQRHLDAPAPAAIGLPWATLGALYEELDLVLGMDSGPLHLAAAVGTPTIRLYGPTDPAVWGPAGPLERHAIVQGTLPCVPCGDLVTPPCGSLADPPCLASVAPEQVVAEARARLGACSVVPA